MFPYALDIWQFKRKRVTLMRRMCQRQKCHVSCNFNSFFILIDSRASLFVVAHESSSSSSSTLDLYPKLGDTVTSSFSLYISFVRSFFSHLWHTVRRKLKLWLTKLSRHGEHSFEVVSREESSFPTHRR